MRDKPFKSIKEQVELLRSRGVATDENTPRILMSEGYYSIVNGYKDAFLDKKATESAGEDRYAPGTTFDDLYDLFSFDRALRELTFHYLLRIEALLETVCAYTFAESHPEMDSYLDRNNYASEEEYRQFGLRGYADNMNKLQGTLIDAINTPKNDAVSHYVKEHGKVPIWVLFKTLTFGNVEHFYNLMQPKDQNSVCHRISEVVNFSSHEHSHLSPKKARRAIDVMVRFRNICAHDERLYCARIDRRNPVDFFGCVKYASAFLSLQEYLDFTTDVVKLVNRYAPEGTLLVHVLDRVGFQNFFETELPKLEEASDLRRAQKA